MRKYYFSALFLLCSTASAAENSVQNEQTKAFILANLTNPQSAQFRHVSAPCGEVRYRDVYGLDSGFKRFIATSGSNVLIELAGYELEFRREWKRACP